MMTGLAAALAAAACGDEWSQDESAEVAFPGKFGETVTGLVDIGGTPVELTYELIDGMAVLEGDILLGEADMVAARSAELARGGGSRRSASRTSSASRWPSGRVPYEISGSLPSGRRRDILSAIHGWNVQTVVNLVPRSTETDFVRFVDGPGCSSFVGRVGGAQPITMGSGCGLGQALHEIGHAIGLYHEHTRADRNNFVVINWNNIETGRQLNFQTYVALGLDGMDILAYDFDSIMHYDGDAFSNGDGPTIERIDGSEVDAQRDHLSNRDMAGVARRYVFDPDDTHSIRSLNSFKCLDIPSSTTSPSERLQQYTCHGGANQLLDMYEWPFSDDVLLVMSHDFMCLTATYDFVTGEGHIVQRQCNGSTWQRWEIYWENGGFRFRNRATQRCMDVAGGSMNDQAKVNHFPCHGGPAQSWGVYFP
jgi:hypothetical protein